MRPDGWQENFARGAWVCSRDTTDQPQLRLSHFFERRIQPQARSKMSLLSDASESHKNKLNRSPEKRACLSDFRATNRTVCSCTTPSGVGPTHRATRLAVVLVSSFVGFAQPVSLVLTAPTLCSLATVLTGWVFARRRLVTRMIETADADAGRETLGRPCAFRPSAASRRRRVDPADRPPSRRSYARYSPS